MKNNNNYSEIVNDLKKANFDPSVYSGLYTDQDRSEYLIKASVGIMFMNIFKEDVPRSSPPKQNPCVRDFQFFIRNGKCSACSSLSSMAIRPGAISSLMMYAAAAMSK